MKAIRETSKEKSKNWKRFYDKLYFNEEGAEFLLVDNNVHDESFFEWLRNKESPADENKINEFLDSIALESIIDFQKLNRNDREKAFL